MVDVGDERDALEELEVALFLEGVFRRTGYDFRGYAPRAMRQRIRHLVAVEGVATISALQDRALHDSDCMRRSLGALTVNVTSMFRDPGFFSAFRREVVPHLRTWPFVRVWHAGCSSGEELYSLAILLTEEGLYERCRIYGTDIDEAILERAREGIYPLKQMREHTTSYIQAGGTRSFSEYYTARYDRAILRPELRANVVFAAHNLATDAPFNEFQVILCRNVMIFFGPQLRRRVHGIFAQSLCRFGFLGLGGSESLLEEAASYEVVDEGARIYRRLGPQGSLRRGRGAAPGEGGEGG